MKKKSNKKTRGGLKNNFGGMILKRLQLRKDVDWKTTRKEVAIVRS